MFMFSESTGDHVLYLNFTRCEFYEKIKYNRNSVCRKCTICSLECYMLTCYFTEIRSYTLIYNINYLQKKLVQNVRACICVGSESHHGN